MCLNPALPHVRLYIRFYGGQLPSENTHSIVRYSTYPRAFPILKAPRPNGLVHRTTKTPASAPLQRLPQQALKSPTGARLILCNDNAGYPDSADPSSSGRGRWVDNIASTDTETFLRVSNNKVKSRHKQRWAAVVLMPEECQLRVGGMSVTELRWQLEKYWGWGGVPGGADEDGYRDMWVPGWAPENTNVLFNIGDPYTNDYTHDPYSTHDPYNLSWDRWHEESKQAKLDQAVFSRWVNRECAQWLGYFIDKNHTFGVVHAWFAAFLYMTRESLVDITKWFTNNTAGFEDPKSEGFIAAISHLKFRMSFDVCIKDFDEVVHGIPSLPLNTEITTNKQGMQVINNKIRDMFPRRIWDICANTVIPATWFCGPDCPLTKFPYVDALGVRPVSHAWVADGDLTFIATEANQRMWPIPLPRGVQLEDVRGEMIRLGVRYAWLDVLCLRQQAQPALAKDLAISVSKEVVERREQQRLEEWKVDVPTIGTIYSSTGIGGIYGSWPIIIFMSGLGLPLRDEGWTSERHWLRRAWTLQETPRLRWCVIAGLPTGPDYDLTDPDHRRNWPWNCKVCSVLLKIRGSFYIPFLYIVWVAAICYTVSRIARVYRLRGTEPRLGY